MVVLLHRLKDIAMAFQQMSQEENNQNFVPLALYLGMCLTNSFRHVF